MKQAAQPMPLREGLPQSATSSSWAARTAPMRFKQFRRTLRFFKVGYGLEAPYHVLGAPAPSRPHLTPQWTTRSCTTRLPRSLMHSDLLPRSSAAVRTCMCLNVARGASRRPQRSFSSSRARAQRTQTPHNASLRTRKPTYHWCLRRRVRRCVAQCVSRWPVSASCTSRARYVTM